LTGKFTGQLVAVCAIDGQNWLYPVAYGVLEVESSESWTWFMENLRHVIGFPNGLVIHTDACKGLEVAVDHVFPGVEYRECMRHLAGHFVKRQAVTGHRTCSAAERARTRTAKDYQKADALQKAIVDAGYK
jgi:transposase-like protein